MSNIPQHPEWAFCGRCKYFDSYNPAINFEKEPDVAHFGRCNNPKGDGQTVAAVADCSMFERKEDSLAPKNMRTIKSNLPIDEAIYEEGFKSGVKSAAITWEDIAKIITIYEAGIDNGDYRRYNDAEWMKEYSQDILRKFNEIRKK